MTPKLELQVSYLAADEQRELIFSAFARLTAGETLELVLSVPTEAAVLLVEFQERYGQSFDWWPLDTGAAVLRVVIAKRAEVPRTIGGFLDADHRRLAECWEDFIEAVKTCEFSYETLFITGRGRPVAIVDRLSQFIVGLRRHILMEESLFFPLFESRTRTLAGFGTTAVMRAEHREIKESLKALEKLVRVGDCATIIQTIEGQPVHPSLLLRSHDAKEEKRALPARGPAVYAK